LGEVGRYDVDIERCCFFELYNCEEETFEDIGGKDRSKHKAPRSFIIRHMDTKQIFADVREFLTLHKILSCKRKIVTINVVKSMALRWEVYAENRIWNKPLQRGQSVIYWQPLRHAT
jgi:hypothetical protein